MSSTHFARAQGIHSESTSKWNCTRFYGQLDLLDPLSFPDLHIDEHPSDNLARLRDHSTSAKKYTDHLIALSANSQLQFQVEKASCNVDQDNCALRRPSPLVGGPTAKAIQRQKCKSGSAAKTPKSCSSSWLSLLELKSRNTSWVLCEAALGMQQTSLPLSPTKFRHCMNFTAAERCLTFMSNSSSAVSRCGVTMDGSSMLSTCRSFENVSRGMCECA